ncbi:ATP-dependent endonuclease [Actinomadura viridis]|uniref:ATP-dependent nuclease n=1 Tax=Actinomadura viridis TaxID=58110 RepID=UPI0036CB6FC7
MPSAAPSVVRRTVGVEVEVGALTDLDRAALGKCAAGGVETVRLWRRWANGSDKLSGRAMGYPPFEEVRRLPRLSERNARYKALREQRPELGLPAARSAQAAEDAMTAWERDHPGELVATEPAADTHFFGFAGQAKMTGLFDYVFVSADLRAGEEGRDAKGSVIGRILDQAVNRTQAEQDLLELQTVFNNDRHEIHRQHFEAQLDDLSDQLTREGEQLTKGRRVRVSSHVPELRLPQAQFQISVEDGNASTRVDQQGHGCQRALLITALRLLAESKATEASRTVFLAVEEPELFQHPVQARVFASVLRTLAAESERGIQISYATHSPYFLEAEGFHQIRRMSRTVEAGAPAVRVHAATRDAVKDRLGATVKESHVSQQFARAYLKKIPEALFARAVILTEGFSDKGLMEGCGLRLDPLNKNGIVVVDVDGKENLPLPHAILSELGVLTLMVFEGDARYGERNPDKTADKVASATEKSRQLNRKLLVYLGTRPEDFPDTGMGDGYAVFHATLETYLEEEWPEWATAKKQLVTDLQWTDKKNEDTYRQAAIKADGNLPHLLMEVIGRALKLAKEN